MTLREMNLTQGIIRAEGQGYSLSSSQVRGLGILAYFTRDRAVVSEKRDPSRMWAPSPTADSFAFGICPCDKGLDIPDLDISTDAKIFELLRQWDHTEGKRHVQQHRKEADKRGLFGRALYGFTFVFGTVTPFLPASGIPIFRSPYPQPELWYQRSTPEEWHTFKNRLGDFLKNEGNNGASYKQLHWIMEQLNNGDYHEAAHESGIHTDIKTECDVCTKHNMHHLTGFERRRRFQTIHTETRRYIEEFNKMEIHERGRGPSSNFFELLKSWVCVSIHRREQAETRLKAQGGKPTNAYGMKWFLTPILTESKYLKSISLLAHACVMLTCS